MAKKISLDEFKEQVIEYLLMNYNTGKTEEELREIVNDDYFADDVQSGYDDAHRWGLDQEVYHVAHTINMCI